MGDVSVEAPIEVLEWGRMLWADLPWSYALEVVLRTTIMYAFALLLLRLMGTRSQRNLTPFDYVVIIAMGSAAGDPMLYPTVALIPGMVVIASMLVLERLLARLIARSERLHQLVEGHTRLVVQDGRVQWDALKQGRMSPDELYALLREVGVQQLGEVKRAYLETNGAVSVFRHPKEEVGPGLPLIPPSDLRDKSPRVAGEQSEGGPMACVRCGEVIETEPGRVLPPCPVCHGSKWLEAKLDPLQVR